MNNLMKVRMLSGDSERSREYDRSPRSEYEPMESRFRDRTGREHYDNGRYAPVRSEYMPAMGYVSPRMGDDDDEYRRKWTITENSGDVYESPQYRGEMNDDGMRRIYGFGGMDGGRSTQANYHGPSKLHEMGWRGGIAERGHSQSEAYPPFSRQIAEEWMANIHNEDGTRGPHWTMEQVKQLMQQRGVQGDPVKVWAAMNAEYSDMVAVNRKYGCDRPEFYLDAAMARWINDQDAVEDKLAAYYACVVKH